jgi:membrane-bound lytic murein transglycosylase A
MNTKSSLTRAVLFAALLVLPVTGCGKTVLPASGSQPGVFPAAQTGGTRASQPGTVPRVTAQLFVPLETHGAFVLSDAESLRIVKSLSPRSHRLSSWKNLDEALGHSLSFVSSKPANSAALSFPGVTATWGDLSKSLERMRRLLPQLDSNPELLAKSFRWVRLGPDFSFTGYYEPTLPASKKPTAQLTQPLYRKPADLKAGRPYFTRNDIDRKGALRGKNLEIAYVDATEAFFLHIQGSGRLKFPDGSVTHVLYAGKNNRQYVSLGRIMKERGILPENGVSMQATRKYLAENPKERAALFDKNPSYVFFRSETYGPIGSMGRVLTPWVSLAVDRRVVPQGSLTMVTAPLPGQDGQHAKPFTALTLPQDSGGAIKGHRIDLFCGAGEEAEHVAGHFDVKGAVYILLPR